MVGPSLDILGGQAVQADRLRTALGARAGIIPRFVPVNPRLPGPLARLQRIKFVRTAVTEVAYLWRLLTELPDADVVHIYSASYWSFLIAPAPAMVLSRLFGKRVLLNYHSGEAADHLARWGWHAVPLLHLADRIVVQSPYLQSVFAGHGLAATVIPNALDARGFRFRVRNPPAPRLLTNRNHEVHYGVATVLRAFAAIQHRIPDASLIVVGSGSETGRLRALADELGLRNVEWAGSVPIAEMPAMYDRADVFLNGSEIDNMPLSILEAYAAGLPVVSTAAGGIPMLVEDGVSGLLVPVGNAPALAQAALRVITEPGLAATLSGHGRRRLLEEFSDDAAAAAWESLYRELAVRA
jgi:glycosyltransferase involved in cell wall biosynthesis